MEFLHHIHVNNNINNRSNLYIVYIGVDGSIGKDQNFVDMLTDGEPVDIE